jgi:hypothetical protein
MLFVESIAVKDLKVYLRAHEQKVSGNKRELADRVLAMTNNLIVDDDDLQGNGDDKEEEDHKEEQTSSTL